MNDTGAGNREVIVIGAGPIGLTTALTLGQRGIRTLLIERPATAGILPKMDLGRRRLAAAQSCLTSGRPLVRSDLHVAWRGDDAADATSTLELTTGRRSTTKAIT
jgi:glycine/D-amino acid oxidase-like deaminating enzyme